MLDRIRTGCPFSSDSRNASAASRAFLPSWPVHEGLRFSVMLFRNSENSVFQVR